MKEKLKIFIAFIIGFLLSSGIVYAATLYTATEVSYDNSSSGTSNTNVQTALDELYDLSGKALPISVSSSAPTYTGKEGELVILSNQEATKYYVSSNEPIDPEANSIWIVEGNSGNYSVSSSNVSFPIVTAKQYINSTWVEVLCYIYQDGKWNLSMGPVYSFAYTGGVQSFTVPFTGTYKLEVWGAQGGNTYPNTNNNNDKNDYYGGKGGYASGTIHLTAGDVLYVTVGGAGGYGGNYAQTGAGGYNGGASGYGADGSWGIAWGPGGGGATHIAKVSGTLTGIGKSSFDTNGLIVAGGGGGASKYDSAGEANDSEDQACNGGAGGGTSTNGTFGQGSGGYRSRYNTGGGGGGYYGGVARQGGSSWTHASLSNVTKTAGQRSGSGYATITLSSID